MNNYPGYTNNGQSIPQQYSSQLNPGHPQSSLTSADISSAQSYPSSQQDMSQSYPYYQQQSYGQSAQLAHDTASLGGLRPLPFQGSSSTGLSNTTQLQNAAHTHQGFPTADHQGYTTYNSSAYSSHAYAQHNPQQMYGQQRLYPPHRQGTPSIVAQNQSSTSADRFPCPQCDKTFTRNFDRKRHMEIHLPGSSGNNRCQYCQKDYSRADSLKRHLDNGCEMKQRS